MNPIDFPDALSSELIAQAVSWRRHLHQHPELAFDESQTSDFIATQLEQFGLEVHRGLGGTGVVGTLRRGTSKRVIGIRADMDALPIEEQSGVPYASSTKGVMHACGHDGHVAMALAAARACSQLPDLDGTVHFVFQPAEEGAGGALRMIEDGLFHLFPCDTIYALHNQPLLPLGSCVVRDGVMLAASGTFEIVVSGRGCHGGRPHQGADPVLAGCQLVAALQSIVSRNIDPLQTAVVSVTKVRAGDSLNVIPERFYIGGTVRWIEDSAGDIVEQRMAELASAVAAGFGCTVEVDYQRRVPATVNDPGVAAHVREIVRDIPNLAVVDATPSTGAEDFSEMLRLVPGCQIWLGGSSGNADYGLHSSRYDFNDELLPLGAALWIAIVRKRL